VELAEWLEYSSALNQGWGAGVEAGAPGAAWFGRSHFIFFFRSRSTFKNWNGARAGI